MFPKVAERSEKLLTEAANRSLAESLVIRANKAACIRIPYIGALAVTKGAQALVDDKWFDKLLVRQPLIRLGGGCQQIVLTDSRQSDFVIKVDRSSLDDADEKLSEHTERIKEQLKFSIQNYTKPTSMDASIITADSPFKGDHRHCLATVQPRVTNMHDMLKITPSDWTLLRDRKPALSEQLQVFVDVTDKLLRNSDNQLLPDFFGVNNLVTGDVDNQMGLYLIDDRPVTKQHLENTGQEFGWVSSLEQFKLRLHRLGELATAA